MNGIKAYCTLLLIIIPWVLYAQQEPMYGQYLFNSSVINPAHAGGLGNSQVGLLGRYQWIGIEGAPKTETLYANLRLPKQFGLAFGMHQDKLGPEVNLQLQADLAYHARLSEDWNMAVGLRITGSHLRVNLSQIPYIHPGNPYFHKDLSSGLLFNAGVGVLTYSDRSFYGLSMSKVLDNQVEISVPGVIDFHKEQLMHLFAYAGTNVSLSDEMSFTPSALFKYSESAPGQLDMNAVFGYLDILDFGLLMRANLAELNNWFDAFGFLVGLCFWENWYFGYMYEYPLTDIQLPSGFLRQTHEISLRFSWNKGYGPGIRPPGFFL